MAVGDDPRLDSYQYLRNSAWEAIGNATVDGAERQRHWKAWESHTKAHGVDPYLRTVSTEERTEALLTFAVAIRSGKYGQKHQIRVQSVDKALRHVAQAFVLARVPDPRRQFSTTKAFDRPIELLLKKYRDTDPPKQPKLAIPVSTIETLKTGYTFSDYHRAIADLVIIAFFFLLRVGEYTMSSKKDQKKKRTVPIRVQDITLWRGTYPIPHGSSLPELMRATSATIKIENTKNGTKNATIHHHASGGLLCPVAAMARRVHAVHSITRSGRANLGTAINRKGNVVVVSDKDINTAVKWAALHDGLYEQGYSPSRVSSHSLRAGGAMALKLNGEEDSTIKLVGRWSSETFITYIHSQIGALTKGLSAKMARKIAFQNIG